MKKLLISILLLLASITIQIKSHFIRGAFYWKNDQLIVLIGDMHESISDVRSPEMHGHIIKTREQRNEFINQLKKLDPKSSLVLVEDYENSDLHKNNQNYIKSKEFINNILRQLDIDNKNFTPLNFMHSDLLKNNISSENIEHRYMQEALQVEAENLLCFKKLGKNIPSQNIFPKDVITEIEQVISNLKKQAKDVEKYKNNYSKIEYSKIVNYFKESINFVETGFEKYIKILNKLNIKISDHNQGKTLNELNLFIENRNNHGPENWVALEANIINKILKNNDKKIIIICAGFLHTSRIEHFISNLGYESIKTTGLKVMDKQTCFDKDKLIEEMERIEKNSKPAHIKIKELFSNLPEQNQKPDYNYNLQAPKEIMLQRKIISFSTTTLESKVFLTTALARLQSNNKTVSVTKIFEAIENSEPTFNFIKTQDAQNIESDKNISFETVYQDEATKLFNICYKDKESGFATDLAKIVECLTSYLNYHKHEITLNL